MRRSQTDNAGDASTGREPLRAVTFDATGTLFHSPRLAAIYAEAMGRHGLEIGTARVAGLIRVVWRELDCRAQLGSDRFAAHRHGARGFWRDFLARLCALADLPAPSRFLAAELYDRFADPEAWALYPEVEAALDGLVARGLRLAVVSNWDDRLPGVLAGLGIADAFETVVYSQAVGVEKPHPAIFHRLLERLALEPQRVLHVGDGPRHDVEGAAAVGMRTLLLDRASAGGDSRVIASLAELEGVLA